MADVSISYKNTEIATMNATGVKTLLTGDCFCEDDIVITYTKPSTPAPVLQSKSVSPTTSQQDITPDAGYDALSQVTVNAITPTKSAQTYTPTTSDQTISAGQWLSGSQTVKGDANLVPGNIKKDVTLFGVTGTYEGGGGGGAESYGTLSSNAKPTDSKTIVFTNYKLDNTPDAFYLYGGFGSKALSSMTQYTTLNLFAAKTISGYGGSCSYKNTTYVTGKSLNPGAYGFDNWFDVQVDPINETLTITIKTTAQTAIVFDTAIWYSLYGAY